MSTDTKTLRVTCPNCGSDHVYHFRYDRDWGYGGDYLPINASVPDAARPDIDCLYCHDCLAAFDGPAYDKNGNRIDYLGRLTDRLTKVQTDLERIQKAAQRVVDASPAKGPLWRGSNEIGELLEAISLAQPQESDKTETLPLMARRPEHTDSTYIFPRFNGEMIPIENEFRHLFPNTFRIADTDEHGLPVIVREPWMPEWARYRYQSVVGTVFYAKDLPQGFTPELWQRIEDYNEREI